MGGILEVLGRPTFFENLTTHVELSVLGLLVGLLIALPLAFAVNRSPALSNVVINIANVGRAVPSLDPVAANFPSGEKATASTLFS